MTSILASTDEPLFAHQLRAIEAKLAREDREAIGGSLTRGGFRRNAVEPEPTKVGGAGRGRSKSGGVDFSQASPISSRDRQGGGMRLPHFSILRINKTIVPRGKDGDTHPDYKPASGIGAAHINYVTDGAEISYSRHVDYVFRSTAVEDVESYLSTVDVLDTEADRRLQKSLAKFSNIPGGRERERDLFEAAERCEREPKINYLTASTEHADYWFGLAHTKGAPGWVRKAAATLMAERLKVDSAVKPGGEPKHRQVKIAKVTVEQAYDHLTWLDGHPGAANHKPRFVQGRTGVSQTRFVAELPDGISPRDRAEILRGFCQSLADDGWMVVGAIHQPDPHGDRRNFHIHVDGYERPAQWLELAANDPNNRDGRGGCWDFEYEVRVRGKSVFPHRANKIPEVGRSPDGKRKSDALFAAVIRRRYVDLVNEVVGGRPGVPVYFAGTYAEAGITRTPLKHLGNAAIAKEKQGVCTPRGSENARAIYLDELEDCHARKARGEEALAEQVAKLKAASARNPHLDALIGYFAELSRSVLERTLQYEIVETVERMATSRADAVIDHGIDPALLEQAEAHLREVDGLAPSAKERKAERERTAALRLEAGNMLEEITALLPGLTRQALAQHGPFPATPDPVSVPAKPRRYAELECGRLRQWMAKWGSDPSKLIFTDTGITLGEGVQPAIHTLFRHYARDAGVQKLLAAERKRRSSAGLEAGVARPSKSSSALMSSLREAVRDRRHSAESAAQHLSSTKPVANETENRPTATPRSIAKGPQADETLPVDPRGKGQGRQAAGRGEAECSAG